MHFIETPCTENTAACVNLGTVLIQSPGNLSVSHLLGKGLGIVKTYLTHNGSRLNGTATFGLEGRVPQLLSQLQKAFCFGYIPGYFASIFLTVDT